ncbi:MAG TPA: FAD-dependent monooxygenase, partial [Nonomuraea sp.]|nr:FAD-dependent monooxygenase [Nonomuraea sp.]
ARSTVRRLLGIDVEDFGTNERWLNFDTKVKRPLPEKFDRTAVTMDPERPYMFMPIGTRRQRFEIRVAEGEDAAAMEQPQVAWDWLRTKQGLGPDDVEIIRQLVYPFETRVARQWRSGRVLLGGDAAHTMPPYAGQGACSAMRDGLNAAWRLDVVLRGQAAESVLDTYEQERRGQYMPLLHLSVFLCGMINMTDPMAAEQRNAHIRQSPPPAAPFPTVTSGIVRRGADGTAAPLAGTLAPQGRVRLGSAEGRYDDVVGRGFQLVCTPDAADALTDDARDWFTGIGGTVAVIGDGPGQVGDLDGVYGDYFTEHAVTAFLNRPDFVVYGAATTAEDISELVEELRAHLAGDLPPAIAAEPQPQTAHAEA